MNERMQPDPDPPFTDEENEALDWSDVVAEQDNDGRYDDQSFTPSVACATER